MKEYTLILILVLSIFAAGCAKEQTDDQLIGGQTDAHGCLNAAGYSWCNAKQKCLRTWEEECNPPITEELCKNSGGNWNECSSRCAIDAQGKEGVACVLMCEALCECGGIAGFKCPEGYTCRMPPGVKDANGYCG